MLVTAEKLILPKYLHFYVRDRYVLLDKISGLSLGKVLVFENFVVEKFDRKSANSPSLISSVKLYDNLSGILFISSLIRFVSTLQSPATSLSSRFRVRRSEQFIIALQPL